MSKTHPLEIENLRGMPKEQYNRIIKSGLFWEYYPEATGNYEKDCLPYYSKEVERVTESKSKHYDKYTMEIKITEADINKGFVTVRMDPYRVCDFYNVGGGPMEHIVKKGLRGSGKGHSTKDVFLEIIRCAERGVEMEDENEGFQQNDD